MKRKIVLLCVLVLFMGCSQTKKTQHKPISSLQKTFYEVFLYSFSDSNEDGIGDIQGLIQRLDYLNDYDVNTTDDLNINGIWLMPIMPSNTYHKYNVDDYYAIDPQYGTMEDFEQLLVECHAREIDVIMDLVINHTSSTHPWFESAKTSVLQLGLEEAKKQNPYVEYYNFVKEKPSTGVYYAVNDGFYEAQFWSEMPDLNLDNPKVLEEIKNITSFWIDKGVDGFRLDAAKEYYSGNTSKNIDFLTWFMNSVKQQKEDIFVVGEVWDSEANILEYYNSGIDGLFNFVFGQNSGLIAKAMNSTHNDVGEKFAKNTESYINKVLEKNPNGFDSQFLANHDTARAAGFLQRNPDKIKFANALNILSSGVSFIYYGEEIGMVGSGKDENKRAPMYWGDGNKLFGPGAMDSFEMEFDSVLDQQKDKNSILNYIKDVIDCRNQFPQIGNMNVKAISAGNGKVAVLQKEDILVVYNFSTEEQTIAIEGNLLRSITIHPDEKASKKENTLTIPGYGIAIIEVIP